MTYLIGAGKKHKDGKVEIAINTVHLHSKPSIFAYFCPIKQGKLSNGFFQSALLGIYWTKSSHHKKCLSYYATLAFLTNSICQLTYVDNGHHKSIKAKSK